MFSSGTVLYSAFCSCALICSGVKGTKGSSLTTGIFLVVVIDTSGFLMLLSKAVNNLSSTPNIV